MKNVRVLLSCAALTTAFLVSEIGAMAGNQNDLDEISLETRSAELAYSVDLGLQQQVKVGFKIAPVPLFLTDKSQVLVGLGSFLVNAMGGCNECHTNPSYAPGGNPFLGQPKKINVAGYLAGGRPFSPPGVVAPNLTPENGLPGGRTYVQFKQIMRTGIDLDNAHPRLGPLLQVMPWPMYQSMTDRDLVAMYTYLSAIPPSARIN